MPESQRSRKQHQKATDIEKHTYVSPHIQTIQFLWQWKQQTHPLQTTCPRKLETFSWRTESLSNFWPPDQKKKVENKTKQNTQTNYSVKVGSIHALLPAEAGSAVLITESGGPHHCPSQALQTGVFKTLGNFTSFFFFFDSPESSWGGSHLPLASSKMPSKQRMFSEPAKILEPISWRTEH